VQDGRVAMHGRSLVGQYQGWASAVRICAR
jgi:hypothetical protein